MEFPRLSRLARALHPRRLQEKGQAELSYWRARKAAEDDALRTHPEWPRIYTLHFGLDASFYEGKRVLDVGCGPRGTLEWMTQAAERVGLDPLVGAYRELGIDAHAMSYVEAGAEDIPFEAEHFDVITCFNALDHVDELQLAISELTRVARQGATLLLITEVNHQPTPTEPQAFGWEVLDRFSGWQALSEKRNEMGSDIYGSLIADIPYGDGPGLLSARLVRGKGSL
jgi:2-polyprenyl-3-methyl-5-hydroxy-6-metoxy-1,4-benzoquinol methylase